MIWTIILKKVYSETIFCYLQKRLRKWRKLRLR